MSLRTATMCVVGIVVLGGCLTSTVLDAGSTPDPKPLPDPPQSLVNETVADYVEAAEEAQLYNERLSRHPTESRLSCDAVVGARTERTVFLYVQCMGGIEFVEGPHEDVATWSIYAVSNRTVERSSIGDAVVRHHDDVNDTTEPDPGYQIVNFDDSTRDTAVSLGRDGGNRSSTLKFNYSLVPGSTVIQNDLPFEYGTEYEVRIQTGTTSETFVVVPERPETRLGHSTVVCVLPGGRIVAFQIPPHIPN